MSAHASSIEIELKPLFLFRLEAIKKNPLSKENPIVHGRDGWQREPVENDDVHTNINENVDDIKDGSPDEKSDPPIIIVSDTSAKQLKKITFESDLKLENKTKLSAIQSSQPCIGNNLDSGQSLQIGFSNLPKQLYKRKDLSLSCWWLVRLG